MFTRRSTRAFFREAKSSPHTSLFDFLHGFIYLKWPYFYISAGTGEHPLAKLIVPLFDAIMKLMGVSDKSDRTNGSTEERRNGEATKRRVTFADTYHGKVVPLESARQLVSVEKDIVLRDLEHVIPYALARDIILKNPDHIAVLQCPCRTARKNPCKPLDVCLIVGDPFASFVLEHHPDRSRRLTPAEAVDILEAEDRRGHVHHAFFKDAMLGRFYAICNCCKCCCGAMQAHRNGTPMLAASGYRAEVDHNLCIVCRTCEKYCQFDAVTYAEGKKHIDNDKCMGCGVCVPKCHQGAINLVRDPGKGTPLEIEELMVEAEQDPAVVL